MAGLQTAAPRDSNYLSVLAIWVPGTGYVPIQGGVIATDVNGQQYAPLSIGHATAGQLLDPVGVLNSAVQAGFDGVPVTGVPAGSAQFLETQATTTTGAITAGQTVNIVLTPTTMLSGLVARNTVYVDSGANQEKAVIVSVTATTITVQPQNLTGGVFTWLFTHSGTYALSCGVLNIERDANGENSGASGRGTAIAAEYEETSGGPALANGTPSLLRYDREVAGLGKVASNAGAGFAISSTTVGDALLTPTVAANFKTLTKGQWIRLAGAANPEYVRVADSYIISTAPATIPLTSPVVNTGQTTATWDTNGPNGPGQTPVLLTGEGFEAVLLIDPTKPGFGRALQGNPAGEAMISVGGLQTTQVTPTSLTVIKATPGRLARILLSTANGVNAILIYDNASAASGTIIGYIAASAAIGTIIDVQMPAANGITIAATVSAATITVSWS